MTDDERSEEIAETGTRYVPEDYDGHVDRCQVCGNQAPMRSVYPADGSGMSVMAECSPCFIGGALAGCVTQSERHAMIVALREDIREVRRADS